MADANYKKISKRYDEPIVQDASTRTNGVDTVTCFAIPGSHLPARHCDVYLNVTVLRCGDMSMYISLNNKSPSTTPARIKTTADCPMGSIKQRVKGQSYICKIFVSPIQFKMFIDAGPPNWDTVRFTDMNGNKLILNTNEFDTTQEAYKNYIVYLLSEGEVTKTYSNTYPFEWKFKEWKTNGGQVIEEGKEYTHEYITQPMKLDSPDHGGHSVSDAKFKLCGNISDYGWTQGLSEQTTDGKIWLCGGILYPKAEITSPIEAVAVPVVIPGLNLGTYYYPGDIRKEDRMSLNRPEGCLRILQPKEMPEYISGSNDPEAAAYTGPEGYWRPVKNTENDYLTTYPEESGFDNWGFRLNGDKWVRLIITGKISLSDEGDSVDEADGIGGDSSSDSGRCPCCCMK